MEQLRQYLILLRKGMAVGFEAEKRNFPGSNIQS